MIRFSLHAMYYDYPHSLARKYYRFEVAAKQAAKSHPINIRDTGKKIDYIAPFVAPIDCTPWEWILGRKLGWHYQ